MKKQSFSSRISMLKFTLFAILGFSLLGFKNGHAQVNSTKYVLPETLDKKFNAHFDIPLF